MKNKRRSWNMTNTALGAGVKDTQEIIFISDAHEKFYYEKMKEVRYDDVYHIKLMQKLLQDCQTVKFALLIPFRKLIYYCFPDLYQMA